MSIIEKITHPFKKEHCSDTVNDVDEAYRKGYQDALKWVVKHLESEWDCSNEDNNPYYIKEMILRKVE
jgi:hypothetical protein